MLYKIPLRNIPKLKIKIRSFVSVALSPTLFFKKYRYSSTNPSFTIYYKRWLNYVSVQSPSILLKFSLSTVLYLNIVFEFYSPLDLKKLRWKTHVFAGSKY